jgi:hypothetical protein
MLPRWLILAALTLVLAGCVPLWAAFTGSYDETQWTFKSYGGEGTVDWLTDSFLMDSGYSGSQSLAQADVIAQATQSGTLHFDWIFYGGTTSGYRLSWLRNNNSTAIVARREYAEGHSSFSVTAGDTIGFRISAPLDEFPALVEVSNFFAPGQESVILEPPVPQTACYGSLVIFSVVASNALDYQWQFKGQDLADENFEDLVLRALPPAETGNYRVLARNPLGSVASQAVPLSIHMPPVINVPPPGYASQCPGQSLTLSATASGTGIRCQWLRDGAVLPGANAASLTLSNLTPQMSGAYVLTVSNVCGMIQSSPVTVQVIGQPVFAFHPQPQSRYVGETVTFNAGLQGSAPAQYQWRFNGQNLSGATSQVLALTNLQAAQAGTYSVVANNLCGSVTSTGALLSVTGEPIGIRIVRGSGRNMSIEVLGSVGRQYILETSEDLHTWTAVGTNWLLISGTPLFYESAERAARFYRVRPAEF